MRQYTARLYAAACIAASIVSVEAQSLTNDLIFYAPFSASLNDTAGGRSGSAMNNPALLANGGVGNGAFVRLTNNASSPKQAVWFADPTPATNDFSFQVWVRAASAESAQNGQSDPDMAIAANKDWGSGGNVGWVLARQDGFEGGQFQWNMNTAGGQRKDFDPRNANATVFDGAWHQLVVTLQRGGNATFYRDGAQIGSVSLANNAGSIRPSLGTWVTNNILALGEDATLQYWHGSGSALNGDLDEVAMWNRVLTPAEILTAYAKGTNGLSLNQPLAAAFVQQPQGGTRYASDNFLLSAQVIGDRNLTLQWRTDSGVVAGATNQTLLLTNLGVGSTTYRLVATDLSGSITSAPAVLTVLASTNILAGIGAYLNFDNNISAQAGTNTSPTAIGADPTPKYGAGRIGSAALFNNDAGAFVVPSDWALSLGNVESIYSNNWSFSLWVNLTNNNQGALLGNKDWTSGDNVGWVFAPFDNEQLNYSADGGPRQNLGVVNVRNGQWRHVAAVFNRDANRVDLYVDGSLSDSAPLSRTGWESLTPDAFFPSDTLVGGSGGGAYSGSGGIDDLGIWGRLLTPAEVLAIYSQGQLGQPLTTAVASSDVRPAITQQPVSTTLFAGRPLTLSVSAAGTEPLVYQWYKGQQLLPGATTSTFRIESVSTNDAGAYTAVVSNAAGSVTSSPPATVTVQPVTSIRTGLAVYLNLDTNFQAQAGTTNSGTAIGTVPAPTYTAGQIGSAALFTNDASSAEIPSHWAISLGDIEWVYGGNWSFSLWVNVTNSDEGALFGNKDWNSGANVGWVFAPTWRNALNYTAQGQVRRDIGAPLSPDGNWRHIAAVFDRDYNRVLYYVDAALVASNSIGVTGLASLTPPDLQTNATLIGGSGPGRWAGAGAVDDVALWTRPLSQEEIIGIYLEGLDGRPLTNASSGNFLPRITAQPRSITRHEGLPAEFSVTAAGSTPLSFQWRKDGLDILNATNHTLSFPATLADQGAEVTVTVSNRFGMITSTPPAVLTVVPAPLAVTNGLVVYLNFNSNLLAQAGTSISGVATGMVAIPKFDTGILGAAARFDNDNRDAAEISDWAVSLGDVEWIYTNNFTLALWVKTTDDYGALFGNKNWFSGDNVGFVVSRYYTNWLNYRAAQAARHDIGAFDWADGAWHHVAAVFYRDANAVYTYVDSNLTGSAPLGVTGTESLTPDDIRATLVGSSGDGSSSGYGLVDDLGIWTRPLNADTLKMIYQSGLRGQAIPQASPGQARLTVSSSGTNILLTAPAWATAQTLEATGNLLSGPWTPVQSTPVIVGENAVWTIPTATTSRFFRLRN